MVMAFVFANSGDGTPAGKANKQVARKTPNPEPLVTEPVDNAVQKDNRLANKVLKSAKYSPHFACRSYPSEDTLRTRDLIPTANIVVIIEYDNESGSYKVTRGDDRVTVKHTTQDIASYEGSDQPTISTEDRFTWTAREGVKTYAWFKEYRAIEGATWGGGELYGDIITDTDYPSYDRNLIIASRLEADNTRRFAIVFTDTTTCKGAGAAPSGMWQDLTEVGLNLPYGARL
jgi:hypothetical protein